MQNGKSHDPGVHLAFVFRRQVLGRWAIAYANLLLQDAATRHVIQCVTSCEGLYVPANRNNMVRLFLDETDFEWLFFLDTDVLFETKQFHELYDAAVENHCDVLGGLYYNYQSDGCIYPTWLELAPDGTTRTCGARTGGIQNLAALGMGFTLINRRVLEAMREHYKNDPWSWFAHDLVKMPDGSMDRAGEDTTFCQRLREMGGFKIQGHSGIALGHDKHTVLTWEKFDYEQRVRSEMARPSVILPKQLPMSA